MRKRLFEIIDAAKDDKDKVSKAYDIVMLVLIVVSLVPLVFVEDTPVLIAIDKVCVVVFIIDYLLRWLTADYLFGKQSVSSFIRYPFSIMAIFDLLSILPSLSILGTAFKAFKVARLIRTVRVFRVLRVTKVSRYSKSLKIISNVIRKSKEPLLAVSTLAAAYILISALVFFNVEPETFDNSFPQAIYFAVVSLSTVGYGDISLTTGAGRLVASLSSLLGIAIVALPSGIITAGYLQELEDANKSKDESNE